jgi:hypothetical protein
MLCGEYNFGPEKSLSSVIIDVHLQPDTDPLYIARKPSSERHEQFAAPAMVLSSKMNNRSIRRSGISLGAHIAINWNLGVESPVAVRAQTTSNHLNKCIKCTFKRVIYLY